MNKKIIITGITGQDGGYMAEYLLKQGYTVYGAVRRVTKPNYENIEHLFSNDSFAIFEMDVTDPASVNHRVQQLKPDYFINFAANSFVGNSWGMPAHHFNTNAVGVLNCLEALRMHAPSCRFYNAGSSEEWGNVDYSPQDEKHPLKPRSPYGASKAAARMLVKVYRESYNMYAVQGWLLNHECLSANTPIILRANGEVKIDYVRNLIPERIDKSKDNSLLQREFDDIEIWDGERFCKLNAITRKKSGLLAEENKKIVYMNSRHGAIATTPNHKFYNESGQKQELRDFKDGDFIEHVSFPTLPCDGVSVTEEFASVLGYLVGDGYVSESSIRFINQNDEVRRDFLTDLKKTVGACKVIESHNPSGFGGKGSIKIDVSAVDVNYVRYIRRLIYDKKTRHKKVPNIILNANRDVKMAFFDSYYTCDGLKAGGHKYKYSSLKTNSPLLAQGLIVLCSELLQQEFCLNVFEQNERVYYQINLNSPDKHNKGAGLIKPKDVLVKTFSKDVGKEFVYDVETESGFLSAGVGLLKVGNSERRGDEFVTQKIAKGVATIYNKLRKNEFDFRPIELGNLDAKRDWSHAEDFMDGIWRMLNQAECKDEASVCSLHSFNCEKELKEYVLASGVTHSVREFVEKAFKAVGIEGIWVGSGKGETFICFTFGGKKQNLLLAKINTEFYRPAEVDLLLGDPSLAREELGWKPKISFDELVERMVRSQIEKQ